MGSADANSETVAVVRNLVAGTVGGVFGILCGHPLDTMKVRLQAMPQFEGSSFRNALSETLRNEGFRAYYRGMAFPLYSAGVINASVFAVEGFAERRFRDWLGPDCPRISGFLGGCVAGFAQNPIVTCVELIKCQLQVQTGSLASPLKGAPASEAVLTNPWTVLRHRVRTLGIRQGCFEGFWVTAVREVPSYGIYFLVYGTASDALTQVLPQPFSTIFAGGMAGMVSLGLLHPVDVVKSGIQALPANTPSEERSALAVTKRGLAREGWRFFTLGFAASQCRAFVINAAVFCGFESSMHCLRNMV